MCGITGFITTNSYCTNELHNLSRRMADAISHRGPDGDGYWVDDSPAVALAHRRLSVVDLTPTGDQPMISHCGNFVIVYNGEVYNAAEIAQDLKDTRLRGSSDTEVILEACANWGVEKAVERLIGMFAFALWDRRNRTLVLVRDRLGIKPLYWSNNSGTLIFGSELKALTQHPDCPTSINHNAIASYLRKCYINGPESIYTGVEKLQPGHILTVTHGGTPSIKQFWSLRDIATESQSRQFTGTDEDAIEQLENLLADAVSKRMIADVPLGAFLSGGIDSSMVAALMQRHSAKPVKTFSIGFNEEKYNEAVYAADVAKHLGTEHTELYVTPTEAVDVIPHLHTMYDEPFADASQIPTFLVSKMTRQHVTVALSGDGGDELFAGYERYFNTYKYRNILKQPKALLNLEASLLERLSPSSANRLSSMLPKRIGNLIAGHKLQRIPPILREARLSSLYQRTLSHVEDPGGLLLSGSEAIDPVWSEADSMNFNDDFAMMQYIDTLDYLPGDILTKVDRASMAVSLEARVPLLDHRVVEFAWTLPQNLRVRNGEGKWLLTQVLYKHVPKNLIDRPKMGFGVPIGTWLRGPLKDWAEDLLSQHSLKETEIFKPEAIVQRWSEHKSGKVNWEYHLWDVLNPQAWAKHHRNGA